VVASRAATRAAPGIRAGPAAPAAPPADLTLIRLPLFLFCLSEELSRPFFPSFARSFAEGVPWLSPDLVVSLPITVFMLVWALSQPLGALWSDRIGRRRAIMAGAGRIARRITPLDSRARITKKERFVSHLSKSASCPSSDRVAVELAAAAMQRGVPVVLLDDEDREDEADLILAASLVTETTMALLIRECSGIVCLCLDPSYVDRLELPQMVADNAARYATAFTVSIDARSGITTGVSAADRVATVRAAVAPDARPSDLVRPGHVFPLRAAPGGVLTRRGHTEGSVDLASIAELPRAALLCELMNPDGTMTRGASARAFAKAYRLPVVTIAEVARYCGAYGARPVRMAG